MNWHILDIEKVFDLFGAQPSGLDSHIADLRLNEVGPNEIAEHKRKSPWRMFFQQFADFMIIILIISALISGLMGDVTDTIVILLIVVLNAIIGFVQEFRAEKALEALKKMAAVSAMVIRDGSPLAISARELVPGDIVLLEAGNVVPADIRLDEAHQLKIEEASLTGESHPSEKNTAVLSDEQMPLGDRSNMAYKGTYVTYGRGRGVVAATGMNTELGRIARMLEGEETQTPLQKRLAQFGKKLAIIVLLICAVVFAVGVLRGEDPMLMLLTSISLAVAAIPEALPAVVTIALALGAKRLVQRNALIRNLPAVETLGSVTFICSDKTGTLTMNKMSVEEMYSGNTRILKKDIAARSIDEPLMWLLRSMALNNDVEQTPSGEMIGDPTEIALLDMAKTCGQEKEVILKEYPRVAELPFDPDRKCMTTVHKVGDTFVSFTKGAIDVLVDKQAGLSKDQINQYIKNGESMAAGGLRVLGFAMKKMDSLPAELTPDIAETNLTFLGLTGMMDPPREEVKEAVRLCKSAGIIPVMITGDHPLTATTIARQLGILETDQDLSITGTELAQLSLHNFEDKINHFRVYARVSPEQKLLIIKTLQSKSQFVAMTGDGVNDAPSLKRADIGIAMGITGTDVSKEASDLILMDDNFATIVKAVREGRRIYDNIRKFIRYTMTSNSGEIWVIFLAPFFGLPIPLLPIHILWINLVTDGLPGLALTAEPEELGIMKRPPRHPLESIFARGLGTHVIWVGLLMGMVSIGAQALAIYEQFGHWQTMVFTVLCLSQMGHVFAIRSERQSFFTLGLFSNLPLLGAVSLTFVLQMAVIYVPFLNPIFKTAPLTLTELALTLGLSCIVFLAVEIEKWVIRRRQG